MKLIAFLAVASVCFLVFTTAQDCPGQFRCSNGVCIPQSWVCDGVTDCQGETHPGSDEQDCLPPTCSSGYYQCGNGQCVPDEYRCDGESDCSDGEDEQGCPGTTCGSNQFRCLSNGWCIPGYYECDHVNDCEDNSDEPSDCDYDTCDDRQCDNGACYTEAERCDGSFDCRDESDEYNCTFIKCPDGQFRCDNGRCIRDSFVCDVWDNCGDRSDEPDSCVYPSCPGSSFTCDNSVCLNQDFVCDGIDNCGDGSDEKDCHYTAFTCLNNQWKCTNYSTCINVTQLCDGIDDCEDGEDERGNGTQTCSSVNCGILSCEFRCQQTPWGGICYCGDGMQVGEDGISCEDFDECSVYGQCEQLCDNVVGSYSCSCAEGYTREIHNQHVHCKANPADGVPKLLYSVASDIVFFDIEENSETIVISDDSEDPVGVDYHYNEGKIFWADPGHGKILSANLNDNIVQTVLETAISDPEQVAVDWIGNNIYFIETEVSRIEVCNMDGSHRASLITDGIEKPRGLALDATKGYMFFTDWGNTNPRVDRAYMDGSEVYTLVDTNMGWPSGITADMVSLRIYWVDNKFDYLETIDYYGKDRRIILSGSTVLPHPFDVTVFEDHVYISDWTRLAVLKANKFDGSDFGTAAKSGVKQPNGLVSYHPVRQPQVDNPCAFQNGQCQHLCVISHASDNNGLGYQCMCDPGYILNLDSKTCSEVSEFLLVNFYYSVRGLAATSFFYRPDVMLPILTNGYQFFVAVTADAINGYVYYADSSKNIIQRRVVNASSESEDVFNNRLSYIRAMALDWTTNNMYYIDTSRRAIRVLNVNNRDWRKDIYNYNTGYPSGIAVNPSDGLMVWSDTRRPANIKKAWLDGTHIEPLVNTSIGTPSDITFDIVSRRVYWVDSYFDRLEVIHITGTGRKQLKIQQSVNSPTAITFFENYVYWADSRQRAIYRIHELAADYPTFPQKVRDGVQYVQTMYYYDKNVQSRYNSNQCNRGEFPNGHCEQYCFPAPEGRTCGCADGFKLDEDGISCVDDPDYTPPPPCLTYQFQCDNGRCVSNSYRCNGVDDCGDNSDETDLQCGGTCASYRFQCDNKKCIYSFWRCDGDDDCGDGSDEDDCPSPSPCSSYRFQCANGRCISRSWVCDSNNDCGDGSDELNCTESTCASYQFRCPDHRCISSYLRCNGFDDCNNGADEEDCPPRNCNPSYYFTCSSGTQCVNNFYRCDGSADCADGSDEENCPSRPPGLCENNQFQCQTSGLCIPQSWYCDARRDCDDGSDEPITCPPYTCRSYQFQCDNNLCVSTFYRCDGDDDCGDGSDEKDCPTPLPTLPLPPCQETEWECPGTTTCITFDKVCDGRNDCPGNTDELEFCDVDQCTDFGCTDKCVNLPEGPRCWCDGDGYQLLNDTKTCSDIDECALRYCSQDCENFEGSFLCKCEPGYELDYDRRTCRVTGEDRVLMLSNRYYIYKYDIDTDRLSVRIYSPSILAIDFDWANRRVYYADTYYGSVYSIFANATGRERLFQSGLSVSESMAVDWVARNLYWCDYELGTIEVIDLEGKHRAVIHSKNVTNPRGLALDPRDGYHIMFWTEWGQNPRIERSDMDGNHRNAIITDNLYWPNGLTLDYPNAMIYFADAKLDFIHRCNYQGEGRTYVLASNLAVRQPHSITVLEDFLYWTDRETKSINRCNKWDGTQGQSSVVTGLSLPTDIFAFHPVRQPNGTNYCANNSCSHLCLLGNFRPRYYTCACPIGSVLSDDDHSCVEVDEEFLVVGTPERIFGISTDPTDQESDKMIPLTNLDDAIDIEHDDTTGFIYWIESRYGRIHRSRINGSDNDVFAFSGTIGKPTAISLDWMSRNLYYASSDARTIEVIRLDESASGINYRKTVLSNVGNETGVGSPRGIAADPLNGMLYWSDQGYNRVPTKIARCYMDGSNPENIVTSDLGQVQHIALDITERRVYWTQQNPGSIKSATFDGNDVREFSILLISPIAITVLDDYIFYSDLGLEVIERVEKTNANNYQVLRSDVKDVRALKIYNRPVGRTNACYNNLVGCEHFCFPVGASGFSCGCQTGFRLNNDGKTCVQYDSFVVVSQSSIVRAFDLETDNHNEAMPPISGSLFNITAMSIQFSTQSILWAQFYRGGSSSGYFGYRYNSIRDVGIDGRTNSPIVLGGIGQIGITSFTNDWISGNIYFINGFNDVTYIEVLKNRDYRRVLLKTSEDLPRVITVNPMRRYLYWADYGQNPKIERAFLNGENRTVLATSGIVRPRGLAIDYDTHEVYWVDEASSTIEKMSFDGSGRTTIRSGRNFPAPCGIALYQDKIYWIDSLFKSVFRISKDPANNENPETIRNNLDNLQAIAIYDASVQPNDTSDDPCGENNGGCDQLCFALPDNTRECDCSYGLLGSDGVSCEDANDFLIYSSQVDVQSFHVNPNDHSSIFDPVILPYPIALTYDREDNRVYFVTNRGTRSQIGYFSIETTSPRATYIVTSGLRQPQGIDFDWKHKRLYYTDASLDIIGSTNLDGKNTTIVVSGLDRPRAIALDPCRGFVYWTDWGIVSKIEKATLAGNARTTIFDTEIYWPNGLTIDFAEDKMYWVDAQPGQERIERSDLDGTNREMVLRNYDHPYSITLLDQFVYWTDWTTRAVYRANKQTGGSVTVMATLPRYSPMDVIAFSTRAQQECTGVNPCDRFNGGCSHLCLSIDGDPECSCPTDDGNNYYLANDGKECIVDEGQEKCEDDQYTCPDGSCKPKRWVCDGYADCTGGVDESDRVCADYECPSNRYHCPNGRCIPIAWLCNYFNDCGDNSDEDSSICPGKPTCSSDEFTCETGKCIATSSVCNGRDDCFDGSISDERGCPPSTCQSGYHKCTTVNICIPPLFLCDGDDDCSDNSDENPSYCESKTCASGNFQCANKHACLPAGWYCDGFEDCDDGSDEPEEYCDHPDRTCPDGSFKCDNGRCIDNDWICDGQNDCRDNSDEDSRHECGSRTCASNEFTCENDQINRCIPMFQVCDGDRNCADALDEQQDCNRRNCTENEFQCANGLCIWQRYECDHFNDCGDYSDEYQGCDFKTCYSYQFTCESGQCIYTWNRCDGKSDCLDGSDEENCPINGPPTCATGEFLCASGDQCIDDDLVCNRDPDCDDKSDELRCNINECNNIAANQCAQICVDTPTSYYCDCNPGYRLKADGKACEDIDECSETPWVCSQLCDNIVGSYYCTCGNGYLREPDGKSCRQNSGIEPYLVFSNRYYIRKISTNGNDYELLSSSHDTNVAIDYDYRTQKFYWTDVTRGLIETMKFDTSDRKILFNREVPNVEGLAVEWVSRKLYWLDADLDSIFVSELNGSSLKTLLKGCIDSNGTYCFDNPRALAVHPKRGYLFWSDWGLHAYIGRAGLNGASATPIITSRISWPNALTIDYVTERIYWGDAHIDIIEFCDIDGKNRFILDFGTTPPHPFAMTFFENFLYWTDWNSLSLYKAHALDGSNLEILVNLTHRPYDVHIVHPYRQDALLENPCDNSRQKCSHLCLILPGGENSDCYCPDHFVPIGIGLHDTRCVPMCTSAQFRCDSTEKCIPIHWQCDGVEDCPDGSDEPDSCPPRHCDPGYLQCINYDCVFPEYRCDGEEDCGDGSDELNCDEYACLPNQYKCPAPDGKCLNQVRMCDGKNDCTDGSDEDTEMCNARTCPPGSFQCNNKRCIPSNWFCDLDDDCGDQSDEPKDFCYGPNHRCNNYTEFSCKGSYRCIPTYLVCDGNDDCYDNSDETICPDRTCHPVGDFRCNNHQCIPLRWRCDGFNDCGDNSDEVNCPTRDCTESEFRCDNQRCIPGVRRCDQIDNCGDGSDEKGCTQLTCQTGYFECNSGHCIPSDLTCDGDRDCNDASDEATCDPRFPDGKYCPPNLFECDNHVCININLRCDGFNNCGDESDEYASVCNSIECEEPNFRCERTRICIFESKVCDGNDDCRDESDEDLAICQVTTPSGACTENEYKCFNGLCISNMAVCDDVDNCGDLSDEIGCHKGETDLTCGDSPCEQICSEIPSAQNQPGFYICSCNDGFKVNIADKHSCLDVDECAEDWSACPQTCNNFKGRYECECMSGYEKSGIGECSAIGYSFLLLADEEDVITYDQGNDRERIIINDQRRLGALDYYYVAGNASIVLWTDTALRIDSNGFQTISPKIVRTLMPFTDENSQNVGRSQELQITELKQPNGLAVDWVAGNLYWTDGISGTLSVSLVDGRYRKVLFNRLDTPHAIALDPRHGRMYWTTIGLKPSVYVSHMNGKEMTELDNIVVGLPTGIAIDYQHEGRLYISDESGDEIISVNRYGRDQQIVAKGDLNGPVSIEVFENSVYWTSLRNNALYRKNKFGLGVKSMLREGFNQPTSVKAFHPNRYDIDVPNRCKPGFCPHLCLLSPSSYTCACAEGSLASNGGQECSGSNEPQLQPKPVCQCRNAGTCIYDEDDQPFCLCQSGFEGEFCEIELIQRTTLSLGAIAAIIVGCLICIALILGGIVIYSSRRGKSFNDLPSSCASPFSSCMKNDNSAVTSFENPVTFKVDENKSNEIQFSVQTTEAKEIKETVLDIGQPTKQNKEPKSQKADNTSEQKIGISNPNYNAATDKSELVSNEYTDV